MNAKKLCGFTLGLTARPGRFLVSAMAVAVLAACSSNEPKLGDLIRDQGVELADIGEQWTEGNELIDEGRDQIDQGQDMISEGEDLIETGEDNIERGQLAKEQAEVSYREKTGRDLPIIE